MSPRSKKVMLTSRQPDYLVDWITDHGEENGVDRTAVLLELLEAGAEGRLYVKPRPGPNPFPANKPLFPALPGPKEPK